MLLLAAKELAAVALEPGVTVLDGKVGLELARLLVSSDFLPPQGHQLLATEPMLPKPPLWQPVTASRAADTARLAKVDRIRIGGRPLRLARRSAMAP